jgi:alpha-tubulin suppressor-like RCC1 family protein
MNTSYSRNTVLSNFINKLGDDEILNIALQLSDDDISHYCQINARFNKLICDNNFFWYKKFLADYGNVFDIDKGVNWKETYRWYGTIWSSGANEFYELGLGHKNPVEYFTQVPEIKAQFVSTSGVHTAIIDLDNNVWTVGDNEFFKTGHDDKPQVTHPKIVPNIKAKFVSAGENHTLLIDLENNVWGMGNNDYGQLGISLDKSSNITLIPNIKAKTVVAGYISSFIIDLEDNVWSFGWNEHGELGVNDTEILIPRPVNFKAKSLTHYYAANYASTFMTDFENNIWFMGVNPFGTNGHERSSVPKKINNIKAKSVFLEKNRIMIIDPEDNVLNISNTIVARAFSGATGPIRSLNPLHLKAKSVQLGERHTIIVDLTDNLWVMGATSEGALGVELKKGKSLRYPTMIPNIKVKAVSVAKNSTVILLQSRIIDQSINDESKLTQPFDVATH